MNERIRQRQQQKIRQIIEQSKTADLYGEPVTLLNQPNEHVEHKAIPIIERQPAAEQPAAADHSVIDSLPPAGWTVPNDAFSPPVSAAAGRSSVKNHVNPYEQDPEKLWKANAAPWLGLYADRLPGNNGSRHSHETNHTEGGSRFWRLIRNQFIVSAILFGVLWGLFKLDGAPAQEAQTVVTTALTTDFDFQTVSAWYDRTFSGSPAFIPLFSNGGHAETVDGAAMTAQAVVSPLPESTLVKSFAQSLGGIELAGQPGDPVSAAETGQVLLVTPDAGEGQTVIIQHAGGRQTQYGQLGEAKVRKDDWVEAGDVIGRLGNGEGNGHSLLYFAVKEDGRFIDPTEVIPLD
ncbi:M23 family metallopeptidase [Paenibacillus kobensis]|uniref:M23 family metallopeptidase n=1 Tax=Paenibacillus kobensis TaxID=59841 RepID=UPI000FD9A5F9|nr:M23 family metallopeptidase [Paenibacillus kobensis]